MNYENIFDKQRRSIYYELRQIGLEEQECQAEADLILQQVTGINRTQQITSDLDHFKADWLHEITRILNSRRQRLPLAYCLGEVEFAGLPFRIIPGVLIPRVDTEILVNTVVDHICGGTARAPTFHSSASHSSATALRSVETHASTYIAEIGVGCGAIAVTLLKRLPHCHVWGCDISEVAITTTLGNARRHNVHERLTLVHGDWKKILPNDFNVIVSNPPYLPLSLQKDMQPEISFEPKTALFDGSEDGLGFYRQFAEKLPNHFVDASSFAAFEIGDKQDQAVLGIFKKNGWTNLSIHNDINGLPRVLTASPWAQ